MTEQVRTATAMDSRVVQCAWDAAEAYVKTHGPEINYAGTVRPEHLAAYVAGYLGAHGWIRKRKGSDIDPEEASPEAIKARCGPEVHVERADIRERGDE